MKNLKFFDWMLILCFGLYFVLLLLTIFVTPILLFKLGHSTFALCWVLFYLIYILLYYLSDIPYGGFCGIPWSSTDMVNKLAGVLGPCIFVLVCIYYLKVLK